MATKLNRRACVAAEPVICAFINRRLPVMHGKNANKSSRNNVVVEPDNLQIEHCTQSLRKKIQRKVSVVYVEQAACIAIGINLDSPLQSKVETFCCLLVPNAPLMQSVFHKHQFTLK